MWENHHGMGKTHPANTANTKKGWSKNTVHPKIAI
jgi:hypothetical protein